MKIQVYSAITCKHDPWRNDVPVFSDYSRFGNPALAARFYKTAPHLLFPKAHWTIWVDGNVKLNKDPETFVHRVGPSGLGVFAHPHRDCLYDEAKVCAEARLDDAKVIEKQVKRYAADGYPKHYGLGATMLLVRRNDPEINALNAKWFQEICNGSIRDQISFPYVFGFADYWPAEPVDQPNEWFTRVV